MVDEGEQSILLLNANTLGGRIILSLKKKGSFLLSGSKGSTDRISLKEKLGYGCGDLACNMLFTVLSSYLMFFYTDIVGLSLASIAFIMFVARIVDALTDPIMGVLIDKTNTRWGKARPYILFGAIPFGIISIVTFYVPNLDSNGKFIYALVTYVLFGIMYTVVDIPYITMLANLSNNVDDRLSFNMYKSVGSTIGGVLATGFTLTLVSFLGKTNQAMGFTYALMIYAVIAVILLSTCFKNTRERIIPIQNQISLKESFKVALQNKPWIILCIICFFSFTAGFVKTQSTLYYAKYYIGSEEIATILLTVPTIISIPIAFIVPTLVRKYKKRNCMIIGLLLQIIGLFAAYLVKTNIPLVIIASILSAVGSTIHCAVCFVAVPDTIDYAEWKTGIRPQGLLNSLVGFVIKLGMAAAGVLCAQILSMGGYVAGEIQSESAIFAIIANYIWIPIIISVLSIIILLFYTLDKDIEVISKDLQSRR